MLLCTLTQIQVCTGDGDASDDDGDGGGDGSDSDDYSWRSWQPLPQEAQQRGCGGGGGAEVISTHLRPGQQWSLSVERNTEESGLGLLTASNEKQKRLPGAAGSPAADTDEGRRLWAESQTLASWRPSHSWQPIKYCSLQNSLNTTCEVMAPSEREREVLWITPEPTQLPIIIPLGQM